MAEEVSRAYDAVAEIYASRFLRDLADDADAQPWVTAFVELVELVGLDAGLVADLGCGPGHGVEFLHRCGLRTVGLDCSPGQLSQARSAFPELDFRIGDLTSLAFGDASLGGIFSRYSIIHLPPARLEAVFAEWARVLTVGAPVLVFFFASLEARAHGTPFDHEVTTAHELFPDTVARQLERVGFVEIRTGAAPPAEGGRPLGKGAVLARRGETGPDRPNGRNDPSTTDPGIRATR